MQNSVSHINFRKIFDDSEECRKIGYDAMYSKNVEILKTISNVDNKSYFTFIFFEKGEFVFIVGDSGSGKSTLIKLLLRELIPTSGAIRVNDIDVANLRHKEIPKYRRSLGVVFQDFQLLMDRSVEDNLLFVLKATGWKSEEQMNRRISEVLNAVGMERKAHKMPYQLSGGEQQRIAIARALLNEPEVIIADEPTGNLDNETADGIMKLLTGINQEKGTAIVMVTHNRQIFEKYPGRVMMCKDERCTEQQADDVIDLELTI